MIRRIDAVPGVPRALGPYSQAVIAHGFVYAAGQVPLDASGNTPEDFAQQVARCVENLSAVLDAAGSGLDLVVKVNGYLARSEYLDTYNRVFVRYFGATRPARTTVCVDLWGVSMELECVAVLREEPAPAPEA